MLKGEAEVQANLDRWYQGRLAAIRRAMENILSQLESYAKEHHGDTPREAGYVYTGAGKRWREAGQGWGDVTANLNESIRGFIAEATPTLITGILTADMGYSAFVELAREGKWAWLWPAVEANEDFIRGELRRIMED